MSLNSSKSNDSNSESNQDTNSNPNDKIDITEYNSNKRLEETKQIDEEYEALSKRFNPFNIPPLSKSLIRPPVHSIPLDHYEISKKPMKLIKNKTQYYIIPVTHNSFQSYNLVNKIVKMVNPDYIAVELTNFEDIEKAKLVAKEQALACQLAEFSGRKLLFIDRPIEFTRQSQKTYWEHSRIRSILINLWYDRAISKDDAEYLRFFMKYSFPLLIRYVSPAFFNLFKIGEGPKLRSGKVDYHEEFDKLLEIGIFDAFYSEREQFMVQKLKSIADEAPNKEQVAVAVVGQLHLPHIKFYWDRDDLLSLDDLTSFTAPRSVVPVYTFQIYLIMFMTVLLWYRSYHYYKLPSLERPKYRAPLTFVSTGAWTLLQTFPAFTMFTSQATIGFISSGLVYTSYNRLRVWGYRRSTALAITSLPLFGYGLMKGYKIKKTYDRALRRKQE